MFSHCVCVCVCVCACMFRGGSHVAIGDLFKLVPVGKQAVGLRLKSLLVYSVSHDEGQSVSKMLEYRVYKSKSLSSHLLPPANEVWGKVIF